MGIVATGEKKNTEHDNCRSAGSEPRGEGAQDLDKKQLVRRDEIEVVIGAAVAKIRQRRASSFIVVARKKSIGIQ